MEAREAHELAMGHKPTQPALYLCDLPQNVCEGPWKGSHPDFLRGIKVNIAPKAKRKTLCTSLKVVSEFGSQFQPNTQNCPTTFKDTCLICRHFHNLLHSVDSILPTVLTILKNASLLHFALCCHWLLLFKRQRQGTFAEALCTVLLLGVLHTFAGDCPFEMPFVGLSKLSSLPE
eukprot:4541998-Amphidinium_carterae.1